MENEIRELEPFEIEQVSGGNPMLLGLLGGVIAFGYMVGKDMALRDNLQCRLPR
ncbi:MAG TPA: hypothetical protein VIP30_14070 [Stenotrophomonas sp.]|jgi:hypothetical protein